MKVLVLKLALTINICNNGYIGIKLVDIEKFVKYILLYISACITILLQIILIRLLTMSRRASKCRQILENEHIEILEKNKELQDRYNSLLAERNKILLVFPIILFVVLLASALNMMSKLESFTLINLSLYILPNIIELVNMPKQHKVIDGLKWSLLIPFGILYILLLSAALGNSIIDTGDAFKVSDTSAFLSGKSFNKLKLKYFLVAYALVPFLSYSAKFKKKDKELVDFAIEANAAITSEGGE